MPRFVDEPRPLSAVLASTIIDNGIMLVLNIFTFAAAFFAFIRFDVL